jgi:hypothetical protein
MKLVFFLLSILMTIIGKMMFGHFLNHAASRMFLFQSRFLDPAKVPTLGFSFPRRFLLVKPDGSVRLSSAKLAIVSGNCL